MKKLIVVLLLAGCAEDEVTTSLGCRTAVDKTTHERVYLRCETYEDFNPTVIRSYQWDTTDSLYYGYRWEKCDQCQF